MRASPLQRKTPLRRRVPLRASRRAARPGYTGELRGLLLAARRAWNRARTPCVFCGAVDGELLPDGRRARVANHHVLERAWIRLVATERGWDDEQRIRAFFDLRNRLSVCERRHLNHHSRLDPIPRSVVLEHCPDVLTLAREWGLEARFERAYPAEVER